jgi:hypothetical protein
LRPQNFRYPAIRRDCAVRHSPAVEATLALAAFAQKKTDSNGKARKFSLGFFEPDNTDDYESHFSKKYL